MTTGRTAQPSLFADDAPASLTLTEAVFAPRPGSAAHVTFRRLIAQIEAGRATLAQWSTWDDRLQQRVASELAPVMGAQGEAARRLVLAIDDVLGGAPVGAKLGRVQRTALRRKLLATVAELLDDERDPDLVALHDKHADQPHAEALQAELAATEALLHHLYDLKLDPDHGAESMDDLMRHARDKLQERAARDAQADDAKREARAARRTAKSSAKDSAKDSATDSANDTATDSAKAADRQSRQGTKQAQQARAEAAIGQSVREVYRKLASVLHPDREPDAEARERKTALMQRVNVAYERRDLLTLLQLQLDAEQVDAAAPATLSDERLLQFNAVLRGQLREIDAELARSRAPYVDAAAVQRVRDVTPAFAETLFEAELAEHRSHLQATLDDVGAVRDPARLRQFIATVRRDAAL